MAELFGRQRSVITKHRRNVFKQGELEEAAIRRDSKRFPEDFMFELSGEELKNWRSQFVTSNGAEIRPTVPGGF
jgi:ORF6N domain